MKTVLEFVKYFEPSICLNKRKLWKSMGYILAWLTFINLSGLKETLRELMEELRTDEVKVEETGKRDDSEDKFTRRLIFFLIQILIF